MCLSDLIHTIYVCLCACECLSLRSEPAIALIKVIRENRKIEHLRGADPHGIDRVVIEGVSSVGMDKYRERPSVYLDPWHKISKLRRRLQVDLEVPDAMRTDGICPKLDKKMRESFFDL